MTPPSPERMGSPSKVPSGATIAVKQPPEIGPISQSSRAHQSDADRHDSGASAEDNPIALEFVTPAARM